MFEAIKELVMNPIGNLSPEEIGRVTYGGIMALGTALTLAIQLTIFFLILSGASFILLAVAMRTPLRPYLVDFLGLNTARTYKRYRAIKKANRK